MCGIGRLCRENQWRNQKYNGEAETM